jgi:hypothetical protein
MFSGEEYAAMKLNSISTAFSEFDPQYMLKSPMASWRLQGNGLLGRRGVV